MYGVKDEGDEREPNGEHSPGEAAAVRSTRAGLRIARDIASSRSRRHDGRSCWRVEGVFAEGR